MGFGYFVWFDLSGLWFLGLFELRFGYVPVDLVVILVDFAIDGLSVYVGLVDCVLN